MGQYLTFISRQTRGDPSKKTVLQIHELRGDLLTFIEMVITIDYDILDIGKLGKLIFRSGKMGKVIFLSGKPGPDPPSPPLIIYLIQLV